MSWFTGAVQHILVELSEQWLMAARGSSPWNMLWRGFLEQFTRLLEVPATQSEVSETHKHPSAVAPPRLIHVLCRFLPLFTHLASAQFAYGHGSFRHSSVPPRRERWRQWRRNHSRRIPPISLILSLTLSLSLFPLAFLCHPPFGAIMVIFFTLGNDYKSLIWKREGKCKLLAAVDVRHQTQAVGELCDSRILQTPVCLHQWGGASPSASCVRICPRWHGHTS